MTYEEIKGTLLLALKMRSPKFEVGTPVGDKVKSIEDYLLESAFMQGELEECLHWLDWTIAELKNKIETMTGYEAALPRKPQGRITGADVLAAKRRVDPPTFEAGTEAKQLRTSVVRQIDRFRFEAGQGPISRSYTVISGG